MFILFPSRKQAVAVVGCCSSDVNYDFRPIFALSRSPGASLTSVGARLSSSLWFTSVYKSSAGGPRLYFRQKSLGLCHEPGQLDRTLRNQPLNASTSFWPAGSRPSDKRNHADYCLVSGSLPQPPAYWSLHYITSFYDLASQFLLLTVDNKF